MIEVINIIEFIQEAQYIMSFKRLEKKTYKRFGKLFLETNINFTIQFEDDTVYILYYDPKEEIQIETNMKLICK